MPVLLIADQAKRHRGPSKALADLATAFLPSLEAHPATQACDLESQLVTTPHEILHALERIKETDGKMPFEIYDGTGNDDGGRRHQLQHH